MRILIVCPKFAPVNAADMHRVRQSLPYLGEFGWEPVILAVDPRACEQVIDEHLLETVPSGVEIHRTRALDQHKTRWVGFSSLDMRARPFVRRAGDQLLSSRRFDLVYFSTTDFGFMTLGPRWRKRFAVPFVVDLQDPWISDYYERPNAPKPPGGAVKYALTQYIARLQEPYTMRSVAHIVAVSDAYVSALLARYSWLSAAQFTTLPFGAPECDFVALDRLAVRQTIFDPSDGYEHWVYVGRAGGDMAFALRAFFEALRRARTDMPSRYDRLRLHFVGTSYAVEGERTVAPIAESCGVGDIVEEITARIPYFEGLRCLRDANALIVPGSDDPSYTASKLYPYLLARRPMLAIFHERSSVTQILRATNGGVVVAFESGEQNGAVAERITNAWFNGPQELTALDESAFAPYTAHEMTRRQCEAFEKALLWHADRG